MYSEFSCKNKLWKSLYFLKKIYILIFPKRKIEKNKNENGKLKISQFSKLKQFHVRLYKYTYNNNFYGKFFNQYTL